MKIEEAKKLYEYATQNNWVGVSASINREALKLFSEGKKLERKTLDLWLGIDESDNLCGSEYREIREPRTLLLNEYKLPSGKTEWGTVLKEGDYIPNTSDPDFVATRKFIEVIE